jgi:hypothetical protein
VARHLTLLPTRHQHRILIPISIHLLLPRGPHRLPRQLLPQRNHPPLASPTLQLQLRLHAGNHPCPASCHSGFLCLANRAIVRAAPLKRPMTTTAPPGSTSRWTAPSLPCSNRNGCSIPTLPAKPAMATKPGRPSHVYQIMVLAEGKLALYVDTQAGNQSASECALPALWGWLDARDRKLWPRLIRGDIAHANEKIMARVRKSGVCHRCSSRARRRMWRGRLPGWPGTRRRIGFKGVSLHNLRPSNGSRHLRAGVPLPVVSARLGHSSPSVTATQVGGSAPAGKERGSSKAQELGSAMENSSAFSQIPCFRR